MKNFILLFTLSIFMGCNTETTETDNVSDTTSVAMVESVDKEAAKASIDELRQGYMIAAKNKDMDALMKMAHPNAVAVMPGAEQWKTMMQQGKGPIPYDSIEINPVEVVVIDHEWAWEMGRSSIYYTPEGQMEPQLLKDTYLMIFRNEGEGWKLYREVASAGAPPQEEEMIVE